MFRPLRGAKMNAAAPAAASIGDSAVESSPPSNDFAATETHYLKQLKVTHHARAKAAMGWRSRFLNGLASSWGYMFALRSAGVSYNTFRAHERNDPEFAAQVREAEAQGAQLLHDVCWKRVMEGDLEPVYWQGQIAGYVRKFDTRLQIEFLRAYKPERFKRPGTQVNVGAKGDVFVLTEEQRHELQRINREWLEENSPKKAVEPIQALPISSRNEADAKSEQSHASDSHSL
jgi:hypothetical protein